VPLASLRLVDQRVPVGGHSKVARIAATVELHALPSREGRVPQAEAVSGAIYSSYADFDGFAKETASTGPTNSSRRLTARRFDALD
jgi:hypothetical protein